MDAIQLRMPPDKVAKMADAIERHLRSGDAIENEADLINTLAWLRYRITRWNKSHPAPPAA